MDKLVAELQEATMKGGGTFYGEVGSFAGHNTVRNAGKPLGEAKAAQELAVHPLVVGAVELLLGPWCRRVVLGTCSAISVEPPPPGEEPAAPQILHRDEGMWAATAWPWLPTSPSAGRPDFSVTVMWAAADFTKFNGATRFLPGSNSWSRNGGSYSGGAALPIGIQDGVHTVQATMPKGSVALWSGGTLHGAGAHAVTADGGFAASVRHGLLFIYNLGWLRPEHNLHWAIPHGILQSFSPKLSELVGLYGENAVEHEWYTGPIYAQPYLGGSKGGTAGEGVQFKNKTG